MEEKIISPLSPEETNDIWNNVLTEIRKKEQKKRRRKKSVFAMALIVLLMTSMWMYHSFFMPDVYLAGNKISEITLGDGTKVILSKGARLTVEKSFPADTREVRLEGDAIFNVTKSKEHPFIVHGNGYETKVLGTVFKISQAGKTFNVDLYEGKVLVYRNGHSRESVAINPKQTFTNYGSTNVASVTKTDKVRVPISKEKTATLIFNKCPISDAVKVIKKTYGIRVNYPAELENTKINISLNNASADAFLQSLAIQLNLNIKQNNDSTFQLER
jgi:transmembrane sensor